MRKPTNIRISGHILRFMLAVFFLLLILLRFGVDPTWEIQAQSSANTSIFLPSIQNGTSSPILDGCSVFPENNIWNTPINTLPVDSRSDEYIAAIGEGEEVHADFGSGEWNGSPIGIPYNVVSQNQAAVPIEFEYEEESDPGPYPIPSDPLIEGGSDRHILVLDHDNCVLYEVYAASTTDNGQSWTAGSGAIFDLNSNALRPDTWTSADAAGLPILAGLVRYDEVASGEIRHAIRFTSSNSAAAYVWPATHQAPTNTQAGSPPMGQRFRLKSDVDISGYSPEVQIILKAMQVYGIILADNGSSWYLSGVPDERWDNDHLHEMDVLTGSDFEAVDVSSLMVDPRSGAAQ